MRRFLAALVLCSIVPASHAALVDNGTYTTDTVTNLDWLDLTETNYFPYGVVSSQLGSGGLWDGWRYATNAEATNLFQTLGFTIAGTNGAPIGSAPAGFSSALSLFVNLFGNTLGEADNVGTYFGAFGVTAQGTDPGDHQSMGAYTYGFGTGFILATAPCCDQSDSLGTIYTGHYLVRDSVAPVPLPAAAWLLLSGFAGLGFATRMTNVLRT